jgi:membrane-associated phospholipid phosphatase
MSKLWWIPAALWLLTVLLDAGLRRARGKRRSERRLRSQAAHGARRLYSRRGVLMLFGGIAASAAFAYSGADDAVETWHAQRVKGRRSDAASQVLHEYGERFWFFYWAALALVDRYVVSTKWTRHGRETFATLALGLPMLWTTQRALGAARPTDRTHGARFVPFADDNTASGHAFISAAPWLVALRRCPQPWAKALCALAVPWVGWSRLNDRKHYLGQILLGGWIAYLASGAVTEPDEKP